MVHPDIDFTEYRAFIDLGRTLYANPPRKFVPYVCMCPKKVNAETFQYKHNYERHLPYCGRCGNMFAWRLFRCLECNEVHLKDFVHPAFCKLHAFCWEHLDRELGIPECGCVGPIADTRLDDTIPPWTTVNNPPPDLSDFDLFADVF